MRRISGTEIGAWGTLAFAAAVGSVGTALLAQDAYRQYFGPPKVSLEKTVGSLHMTQYSHQYTSYVAVGNFQTLPGPNDSAVIFEYDPRAHQLSNPRAQNVTSKVLQAYLRAQTEPLLLANLTE